MPDRALGYFAVDVPEARCLGLHTEIILDTPTESECSIDPVHRVCVVQGLSLLIINLMLTMLIIIILMLI